MSQAAGSVQLVVMLQGRFDVDIHVQLVAYDVDAGLARERAPTPVRQTLARVGDAEPHETNVHAHAAFDRPAQRFAVAKPIPVPAAAVTRTVFPSSSPCPATGGGSFGLIDSLLGAVTRPPLRPDAVLAANRELVRQ